MWEKDRLTFGGAIWLAQHGVLFRRGIAFFACLHPLQPQQLSGYSLTNAS